MEQWTQAEVHTFNKRNMMLSEQYYYYATEKITCCQAACGYFGIAANGMPLNQTLQV